MRVALYIAENTPRERAIVDALRDGCAVHGDDASIMMLADYAGPDHDVAVLVGRSSGRVFRDYLAARRPVLIVEKGYFARKTHERVEIWCAP